MAASVRRILLEDVKRRRRDELVFVGEEQRMEAVDELRDVRHRDLFRMTMKGVERQRGQQRIPHRRLLAEEVRRIDGSAGLVPRAPFIDDELQAAAAIELAHHRPVARDQPVHTVRFVQQLVPFIDAELHGVPLAGYPIRARAAARVP